MQTLYRRDMKSTTPLPSTNGLVVFSHLRWEFVKQRPQHLIERFSKTMPVLFVEESVDEKPTTVQKARELHISSNLTVIQPYGIHDNDSALSYLVSEYMQKLRMEKPMLWFYSAAFGKLREMIPHSLSIYDCMDELSAFRGADPTLITKEKELLKYVDVVFTGGYSLYMSKKQQHANVYAFPSSVDRKHFAKSLQTRTAIPADLQGIPHPIAGFYGVLDERMDLNLIRTIATSLPRISFVFIGPVVKISPVDLPQAPNIHYLGQRSYDVLPNYLKGFDMAIMPFALNEATRFISPTKTLEFMAALKPIISTRISDVVHDFRQEVAIAKTAEEFIEKIEYYRHEPALSQLRREILQKAVISRTSWDTTAIKMQQIMKDHRTYQQKGGMLVGKPIYAPIPAISYI